MTPLLLAVVATLPCVYWTQGIDSRATIESAGITRLCVPADRADEWRKAGLSVTPVSAADLEARELLPTPGVTARSGVASPTRSPWVVASGWRIRRSPDRKYRYDVPAGKGALAVAEAFAYGADALVAIDPADLPAVARVLAFFEGLPADGGSPSADLGIVDDGSPVTGEVMNLLARRNLLFEIVKTPAARYPINIAIGAPDYPQAEAADPSAFALKIRRQLTDERRSLRVFGSEVVICRLTVSGKQARLQILNYGGRPIEGLRLRVRGEYARAEASAEGAARIQLDDLIVEGGFTEFSLPRLSSYVAIDLAGGK